MESGPVSPVLRFIRRMASRPDADPGSGGLLVERFVRQRDEASFAALVQCYGSLVLGVCRRVLRHEQDAEDAFQATFLVLARKAGSIHKRESVASWLYGVAYRVACKARAVSARRHAREGSLPDVPAPAPPPDAAGAELREVLDEEVSRLPARYREPVVLCYLEGKTTEEAAKELGCPKGTVLSRLARARARLQPRLERRGLAPTAGVLAAVLTANAAVAAVPAPLLDSTIKAGAGAGGLSARVGELVKEAVHSMLVKKIKTTVGIALLAGLLCAGVGVGAYRVLAAYRPDRVRRGGPSADPAAARAKTDRERIQGKWFLVSAEVDGKEVPKEKWLGTQEEVTIEGDEWVDKIADREVAQDYRLDPSAKPGTIDFLRIPAPFGEVKEVVQQGVYRLKGDTLTICMAREKGKRPTEFKTTPGSGRALTVYSRKPLPRPPAKPEKKYDFVKAEVSWQYDYDEAEEKGGPKKEKKVLTDRDQIARLASFYPGMGQGKKSPVAGGWIPYVSVTFHGSKGETVRVWGTYESWTEGQGDWKTKPGLRDFIKGVFEKKG